MVRRMETLSSCLLRSRKKPWAWRRVPGRGSVSGQNKEFAELLDSQLMKDKGALSNSFP